MCKYYFDYDEKKSQNSFGFLTFLAILGVSSYWISQNIYKVYNYEIKLAFSNLIDRVKSLFSVIFKGEYYSRYLAEPTEYFWVFLFIGLIGVSIYSSIRVFFGISDAWENLRKKNNSGDGELKNRILRNYKSYADFKENYPDFYELSAGAREEVRKMFENY